MKKKLLITTMLVLTIITSMALMLAGCGGEDNGEGTNIFEKVDTEDFTAVKDAITTAVDSMTSCTINLKEDDSDVCVQKLNNGKLLMTHGDSINYFVTAEGSLTSTRYGVMADGTWVQSSSDETVKDMVKGELLMVFNYMNKDNSTYDKEAKLFVYENKLTGITYKLQVGKGGYRFNIKDTIYNSQNVEMEVILINSTSFDVPEGVSSARPLKEGESFPSIF